MTRFLGKTLFGFLSKPHLVCPLCLEHNWVQAFGLMDNPGGDYCLTCEKLVTLRTITGTEYENELLARSIKDKGLEMKPRYRIHWQNEYSRRLFTAPVTHWLYCWGSGRVIAFCDREVVLDHIITL